MVRRVAALLAAPWLAATVAAAPARADEPPLLPPELRLDPPSLAGRPPPGPRPWRAVAEEGIILGVAMLGYAVGRPPTNGAEAAPILDKVRLAHGAWGYDADSLPMNYLGHPVGGAVFYQVARGNRLGVAPSAGLTLASAWVWELAEYREFLSVHDVVSSTAGGVALGEALGQLAAWLAEREGGAAHAASVLFQIPRAFHDRYDRAPPAPPARWGLVDVAAWSAGASSWPRPEGQGSELRLGARARLVRADEVGEPGEGWRTLLDGNVTSLVGELAVGRPGLVGIDFTALASLVGLYGRDLDAAGDGTDLLATVSFGFDYLRRAEPVGATWANDYLVVVRTPGAELVAGLRRGALRVALGVEAALTLGAVQPLPLLGQGTDLPGAPRVLKLSGYYHGLGGMLAPRASLAVGPVELVASLRLDRLSAIERNDVDPPPEGGRLALEDERQHLRVGLAWRLGWTGARLHAEWQRRDRWGRAGQATATLRDSTASVGVGLAY